MASPFSFFVLPVNSIAMRPLPRLLRYAPKAREGTLKLHFYLESIEGILSPFRPFMVSFKGIPNISLRSFVCEIGYKE